ncbi:hypothetical protein PDJAM_G00175160 [Pangasius djambal]|uniref:Uncharacterized protein n=1 Tax=Pangasius djambal TaxID=1691987 RepID=A0ACC5ZNH3_9TELE|nr:hypothetical protein [Pangasius djambal]
MMYAVFRKQKIRKAKGPDGVSPACLKACAVQLSSIFTLIFNRSLELCEVPSCFKRSTIIPVPKKPKITGLIESFERLVLAYLKDPLQFAYRANRSVDDAVNMRLHYILQHLDKPGAYARILFVDFSSAFNTIIPDTLLNKLTQLSVPTSICQWITSFLTDRQQLAATNGDSINLEEYTSSVTSYIGKCIDDVTISKSITARSNQKPWMTAKVRALLNSRDSAFRARDKVALRTARAELSRAIREAKRAHAKKIHGHFQDSGDTRRMWQGIQAITNYKTTSPACDSDASLPDVLNDFYAWFEAQNNVTARKTTPPTDDQVICLTTDEVRNTLRRVNPRKSKIEMEKKTKWWKLKKEECCEDFRQKLRQALGGQAVLPDDWDTTAEVIRVTGRKVLGVSSGRRKEDKETWWWNEEVQDSIQGKRLAKKKWDMDRTEENRQEYKELQRRVKREVAKAKQEAYDELYTRLDTREGQKDLYRLARQRDRDGKDVQQVGVIKDRDGRVLTSEESIQRRWKEYFEELMNEKNEREKRIEEVTSVEQKVDKIRKDEVRKAFKRMKNGKAVGPDDIPVEVWKCLGEAAVEFLTSLFNRVLESEKMPEEWRSSVLVLIFKNKGDMQNCSNYRGIKLMSHTVKLWERVGEARLRKFVSPERAQQMRFLL